MHFFLSLTTILSLLTAAFARCYHDNCYRAVERYHSRTAASFCNAYLAARTPSAASHLASFGPTRISSACNCLTITSNNGPNPTLSITPTTFDASTCARNSINACPTPYDPCCAYICAEAQVPFDVCSPENETVLAQCSKCPSPTSATSTPISTSDIGSLSTLTITSPTPTTLSASTCTVRLLSTPACPTPYDPCCAWNCEEAQVPFNVCSQTDGSGEFAVCTRCPSPAS